MRNMIWLLVLFSAIPLLKCSNDSLDASVSDDEEPIPDEQRLMDNVFSYYDSGVRPVFNSSNNVIVRFGFTLIQIMDLEEKSQVLVTNAWLEHIWRDERITWDPSLYNGLSILRLPANILWLPDIVLYNNADDFTSGYMLGNVMITDQGEVSWAPPARLRSSCKIDVTYFPFDTQQCRLKFGSWTYDKAQVDIVNKSENIDVTNYVSNGEWQLLRYSVIRKETVYPAIVDAKYPDVTVTIVVRRRVLYYVLNILFPCIWLSVLSILTFCLPPDEGEKVTLGITVLLSYSVFMLLIAEKMPPTSEFVPLIGIYLTIVMATTCISIFLTVLVLKLYHQSPNQQPVPNWVKFLVLQCIARLVQCRCVTSDQQHRKTIRNAVNRLLKGHRKENAPGTEREIKTPSIHDYPATEMVFLNEDSSATTVLRNNSTSTSQSNRLKSASTEMTNYIQLLVQKSDSEQSEVQTMNEWKQVSLVMDRLLFWIFFITTSITTLTLLVVVPFSTTAILDGQT